MSFQIIRNDITNMRVDAIVNTANPYPIIGRGTDSSIHEKAGPQPLQARKAVGNIAVGQAAITPAFDLHAKYVIHTVGPVWEDGNYGEEQLLRSCYDNSLSLAVQHKCKSIAFPLISSGNYGFPKDKSLQIAISAFSNFLIEQDMKIYLVVFDQTAFKLSEKLFQDVDSYIDQHYVDTHEKAAYGITEGNRKSYRRRRHMVEHTVTLESCAAMPMAAPKASSLPDFLEQADTGFSETLLKLIDQAGYKDSLVYKKAHVSKQHFSKIRNNPNYKPTKETAIAFALALELDVAQTNDLIGRAGYTLSNSSKFDLIIRYFIEQKKFNIVEIDCTLFEFDQPLLGS